MTIEVETFKIVDKLNLMIKVLEILKGSHMEVIILEATGEIEVEIEVVKEGEIEVVDLWIEGVSEEIEVVTILAEEEDHSIVEEE